MSDETNKMLAKLKKAKAVQSVKEESENEILPVYAHLDDGAAKLLSSFRRGLIKAVQAGNADPESNDIGGMDDGGL